MYLEFVFGIEVSRQVKYSPCLMQKNTAHKHHRSATKFQFLINGLINFPPTYKAIPKRYALNIPQPLSLPKPVKHIWLPEIATVVRSHTCKKEGKPVVCQTSGFTQMLILLEMPING